MNWRLAKKMRIPILTKEQFIEFYPKFLEHKEDTNSVESSDLDEDFESFFKSYHSSDSEETISDLTSESTDFSFTSTYTESEDNISEGEENKEDQQVTNPFEEDFLHYSESSSDEEEEDLRNSILLRSSNLDIQDDRTIEINHPRRENTWEAGSKEKPYFPDIDLKNNEETINYYCPKSFLLKKRLVNRTKWCLLQLQFCEEKLTKPNQSYSFSFQKKGGQTKLYYRVVEKEYFAFDDDSEALEYHSHATSLDDAQRILTHLYEYKMNTENYHRVSVFQSFEEKQMALCSPDLLTTPLSKISNLETNISKEVIDFSNDLMKSTNSYIFKHLEQLRVSALGELITPTGGVITLSQIVKSETILYKLCHIFHDSLHDMNQNSNRLPREKIIAVHNLSKEYYDCFSNSCVSNPPLYSLEQIREKIELSQLLRDMMELGEEASALSNFSEFVFFIFFNFETILMDRWCQSVI